MSIDRTGRRRMVRDPNLTILLKSEYVSQSKNGLPITDIRDGGQFRGIAIAGVIAF